MPVILIADDESSLRRLVVETVRSDEYTIVEAADGDEAWRLVQDHRPALALLDVQMPGRSGLELVQAIKGHPDFAGIGVILLTARAQEEDIAAGLASGADHYLTKPFSPLQLLRVIEEMLGPSS